MTGTIVSVTIPKKESKSALVTVQVERSESDNKFCYFWEGPKFETAFVSRVVLEAHPELYVVGSLCNIRYSKSDDGRYFANIYF